MVEKVLPLDELNQLAKEDKIIREDIHNMEYFRGLGDRIFEIVLRNIYEAEIEDVGRDQVTEEIIEQLSSVQRKVSYYKGLAAEYQVINRLMFAVFRGKFLDEIVENPLEGMEFGQFKSMKKAIISIDQEKRVEADIFCENEAEVGVDFIIEVKDWETNITNDEIQKFIDKKILLESNRKKKTGYIFYSEKGLTGEQKRILDENGIMYTDGSKLVYL